ncbi:MAG: VanZ family protein [Bacteroidales bacterium]
MLANKEKRNFLIYNWPGIAWAVVILVLIGVPGNYIPAYRSFVDWISPDKVVHFIMFGGLSFFLLSGLSRQYQLTKFRWSFAIVCVLISIVYGGVTELLQAYVFVGRDGNIFDFLANVLGAILGSLAYGLYLYFRKVCKQRL